MLKTLWRSVARLLIAALMLTTSASGLLAKQALAAAPGHQSLAATSPQQALTTSDDRCVATVVDVRRSDPRCPEVSLLVLTGIVAGDANGYLRIGENITRAEMAKVLVKLKGLSPQPSGWNPFTDLGNHWVATQGWAQAAYAAGIIKGRTEDTFDPDAPVTRAEAVAMIARAEGLGAATPPYVDLESTAWYFGAVGGAYAARVIDHPEFSALSEVYFHPGQFMTRGEVISMAAAAFLMNPDTGPACTGSSVQVEKRFTWWDWSFPFRHTKVATWQYFRSCGKYSDYSLTTD